MSVSSLKELAVAVKPCSLGIRWSTLEFFFWVAEKKFLALILGVLALFIVLIMEIFGDHPRVGLAD